MGALDWVAGKLGYVQAMRPRAGRAKWGFDAAQMSRLTSSLQSEAQFINTTLRFQGRILRARSRQAAQNNPFARRFVQMVVDNVCGPCPFELEGKVKNARGKLDKDANERIEEAWEGWSRAGQCEITEKWSLATVQRLLVRIWAVDGELLVRRLRGPEFGSYGYRLQIIDVDRLYEHKNQALADGGAIHSGVEVDPTGKVVAYHVLKRKPAQWQYSGFSLAEYERIPAGEVTHLFAPEFAEQIRGVPMMYAALLNLVHLGAFEEAAVIAARVGAANMGFIESPDGGAALAATAGAGPNKDGTDTLQGNNGEPQISAEPGAFWNLPPGYKMGAGWNPKYPDAAVEPFIRACLRGVAAGLGVAYHNLANDLENVNYSSARIGELDERDTWRGMQEFWCEHFNQPVYEDWLRMQVVMGTLPFDMARLEKYRAVYWQARRWAWVDPLKEVGAAIEAINARITSRTRIAAENGVDLEDVVDEIAAEEQMFKDNNIELAPIQPHATGIIPNDQGDGAAAGDGETAGKPKKKQLAAGAPRGAAAPEVHVHFAEGAFKSEHHAAPINITNAMPEREMRTELIVENGKGVAQAGVTLAKSLDFVVKGFERATQSMVDSSRRIIESLRDQKPPLVQNEIKVEPASVEVRVEPAPVEVTVKLPTRESVSDIERDDNGDITRVTQVERDA